MPDVLTLAKPLGCGVPMGAVVANERAASSIGQGMHGSTFGGGALVCRVALEFFDILDELMPSIECVGAYFRMRLMELQHKHGFVKEIRGEGLMIGMELTVPGKQLVLDAMNEGLLINCTHEVVLRFFAPLHPYGEGRGPRGESARQAVQEVQAGGVIAAATAVIVL